MAHGNQRRRLMIDSKVQGALLARSVLYWIGAIGYFATLMFTSQWVGSGESFSEHLQAFVGDALFWLPAMLMILPLVCCDMLRTSLRFAGPAHRLRHQMQRLAAGEPTHPLRLREGDHWQDLAESFNRLREIVDPSRANPAAAADPSRALREGAAAEASARGATAHAGGVAEDASPALTSTTDRAEPTEKLHASPSQPHRPPSPTKSASSSATAAALFGDDADEEEEEGEESFQSIVRSGAVVKDAVSEENSHAPPRTGSAGPAAPSADWISSLSPLAEST